MDTSFAEALRALSDSPMLQGSLAAFCTFILEDPTTLACSLLVADGKMLYSTALIGLALGIGLGDWGLYALGRFVGERTVTWGLVSTGRLERVALWFEENMFTAVMVSRFVPGLRLPANLAAGMARATLTRYLPMAMFASVVWTFLALTIISSLGEAVLPVLGGFKYPFGIVLIGLVIYIQRRAYKRMEIDPRSAASEEAPASFFEFWHPIVFYAPVAAFYAWLALRYRSLTLPTAANPSIYSGGMIRESKSEILELVPDEYKKWVAQHTAYHLQPGSGSLEEVFETAKGKLRDAGLAFPVVAKPDMGQRGAGVRPLYNEEQLKLYLDLFPSEATICFQKLVPYPHEAGLLYHRLPTEERGRITSITLKEFPTVTGDGKRTLRELIDADSRASLMREIFFARHEKSLDRVLDEDEDFRLVFAGNHAQGCVFKDGIHILTPALAMRIDEIAKALPEFYFGRFDLRFRDLDALQRGEEFQIVEINGAGAEATHIWDPDGTLSHAYSTLFKQFAILFKIGDLNRKSGHAPLNPIQFLKDVVLYHRVARKYPSAE